MPQLSRRASHLLAVLALACGPGDRRPRDELPALRSPRPSSDQQIVNWWSDAVFDPRSDSVLGIAIQQLDSAWLAVLTVQPELLPPAAKQDVAALSFREDGDFNFDGRRDRAVVGVYRNRAGTTGPFLLVTTNDGMGKWHPILVESLTGSHFSHLTARGDTLWWWFCLYCDFGLRVEWSGSEYRLKSALSDDDSLLPGSLPILPEEPAVMNVGSAQGYSIRYVRAIPAPGTPLAVGEHVRLSITVSFDLQVATRGTIVVVLQRDGDLPLFPGRDQAFRDVGKGSGEVTVADEFDVPDGAREVLVYVPLAPEGFRTTQGEIRIRYPVRGGEPPNPEMDADGRSLGGAPERRLAPPRPRRKN